MEKVIVTIVAGLIGAIYGYKSEFISEKLIDFKEDKKGGPYERYSYNVYYAKIIDIVLTALLFGLSFYYFHLYKAILASIFAAIGIIGVKIDQKIRIIPNELVLLVLVLAIGDQIIRSGFKGLISGGLALLATAVIFFLSGYITKLLSGSIGVGAGDIKLAMAISVYAGIENILDFYLGIAIFLAIYILIGLKSNTMKLGSTFPMATQIMGGFMVVIFGQAILEFISKVY